MYAAPELFIANKRRPGRGNRVPVVNPATEDVLGEVAEASAADVAEALASAEAGFHAWRKTSAWARAEILRRIAGLIRERLPEIAELLTLEVGKPLAEAKAEVMTGVEHFEWAADIARHVHGEAIDSRAPENRLRVTYEPVGIALALTAWNFPINLAARKLCMALAAGCSVIVRPASESPGSIAALVGCCVDAGLPPGAINFLLGTPETVIAPLMRAPSVRKVSFTGSTRVGKLLIQQSADTVKRLTMELGGHAPVLVMADADVDFAAKTVALAKFRNAGQVCASPSRFYVHESVADRFTDGVVAVAKSLKVGNGMDSDVTMGPLATARQRDRAEALVADARKRDAKVATGGARPRDPNRGFFFEPTVLTNLDPQSSILVEEPFAPIAPILPFSDTVAVLAEANKLEAGLAAYVFTRSLEQANTISEQLEAGLVGINTCAVAMPEAPFGGVKQSGYGREGGSMAIYDYLNVKFTHTRLS